MLNLHDPLRWKCRKIFSLAIFLITRVELFSKFPQKIFVIVLRDIIGLETFLLSFSQS